MNRRTFFKAALGFASVAVVGFPKVEAATTPQHTVTPSKPRLGGGCSIHFSIHEQVRYREKIHESHRGFLYTYTPEAYRRMVHRLDVRKRVMGSGHSQFLRVYSAEKIVRIRDGKVFKSRSVSDPEYTSQEEWNELFGRIA